MQLKYTVVIWTPKWTEYNLALNWNRIAFPPPTHYYALHLLPGFKLGIVLPLSFPSAGITGVYHQSWLHFCLWGTKESNPEPYSFTELNHQPSNLPSEETKGKKSQWSPVILALGQLGQEDFQLSSLGYSWVNSRPVWTIMKPWLTYNTQTNKEKTNLVIKPKGHSRWSVARWQTTNSRNPEESSLLGKAKSYLTVWECLAPKTFSLTLGKLIKHTMPGLKLKITSTLLNVAIIQPYPFSPQEPQ